MPERQPLDLQSFTQDWRRLQQQKQRRSGGVEARILLNLAAYYGELAANQDRDTIISKLRGDKDEDKNKLHLVFSLLRKQVRRKAGRLWSIAHEFSATPNKKDPRSFDKADVVDQLIRALDKKVGEKTQQWLRLFWLLIGGVAIEHTPWVMEAGTEPIPEFGDDGELLWVDHLQPPDADPIPQSEVEQAIKAGRSPESFAPKETLQLVGDVGSEVISPLNFFIEASCTAVKKLAPDQACYIAEIKTVGWVSENFGSDYAKKLTGKQNLDIVKTRLIDGPALSNVNLRDLIPAIQGTRDIDDPPMCIVLTRYQPPHEKFPHGRRTIFVPDQCQLDDDDLPYEDVPITDIHWEPNATTFWTGDFLTDLLPAQKFLNKRVSQLGEASNAQIYEVLLLGGELDKNDVPSDMPGVIEDGLDEQGQPRVQPLVRGTLPGWFMETIKFTVEFIENVGGADLLQNKKFPGQLRGSLSAPILQEILDSEDGPFYDHLGEQLARIKQLRVNRVKQFYEPIRTLHYTGQDMRDEVLVFHADEVLRSGTDFDVSVDRSSIMPEISALREARIRERLEGPMAVLYLNPRTGKIDPSKIAQDLKYTDRFRESRESQYRRLAQQLIGRIWQGEPLDPTIPLPFWDHDVMMDELEAGMSTTEWIEASPPIKQAFIQLHEKHRQFLSAIHEQMQQSMESRSIQSAVAQATQQAAAKAASMAVDSAMQQIAAQSDQNDQVSMQQRLMQAMNENQQQQQPARGVPAANPRNARLNATPTGRVM